MSGTATASLWPRSSAAWPPRPKIATRAPVLPRFRVGIGLGIVETGRRSAAAALSVGRAAFPITAAAARPLSLRNSRRFGFTGLKASDFDIKKLRLDFLE